MIPIHNIYYMLTYAFKILKEKNFRNLCVEQFSNTSELMAAILERGVSVIIKHGLWKEYITKIEIMPSLRGKIDISQSIKSNSLQIKQMICDYDDLSVNCPMNRIIKSTLELLLRTNISKERKKTLRKLLNYFSCVKPLNLLSVDWNIQYNRNNQLYVMVVAVCYLTVKGLIQLDANGSLKIMDLFDEQRMCRLYERFILEYYKKEFPNIKVNASQIRWQLDDGNSAMLPIMQTDVMLSHKERILIIDAKYYARATQKKYGVNKLHSANLYQIFTYVKNKEFELSSQPHKVAGLILYAKTDENIQPNNKYCMSGNTICVKTLDLNLDFNQIKKQLNDIVMEFFSL